MSYILVCHLNKDFDATCHILIIVFQHVICVVYITWDVVIWNTSSAIWIITFYYIIFWLAIWICRLDKQKKFSFPAAFRHTMV